MDTQTLVHANQMIGIDMRSDTVTLPSVEMRLAMANAVVGDDVYKEDPTVNKLEAEAAALTGKEAALFVSSGTQGNLIAILVHCKPGESLVAGDLSHTVLYEGGGMSAVGGILSTPVPVQQDGTLSLADIEKVIHTGEDDHYSPTRLIILENTQNRRGGAPLSAEYTDQVASLAKRHNLKLHIDGARLFNAAVALGVPVSKLLASADSASLCLSKGLGAPVGSVLVGTKDFIREAKRKRKMLGGGMRQAGMIAAAGIFALNNNVSRLAEDHANVKLLAKGLSSVTGINVLAAHTNMLLFEITDKSPLSKEDFVAKLKQKGILVGGSGPTYLRAVAHVNITQTMINTVIQEIKNVLS